MPRKFWTAKDLQRLRELYPHMRTDAVAKKMRRTTQAVYGMAGILKLHKSEEYLASPEACRLRRGDNIGAAYRFKPGQAPANKGLRRPGWAPGRMAETQFKPGVRTGIAAKNWRPIGTILADHEGYLRIKVREGRRGEAYGFGNTKIWPLLQRHVWEQHHGPIPEGHTVVFKDRDRSHCEIENLELISRRELMARNTVHNLPPELKQVIQLNGALKRKIRGLCAKQDDGSAESSVRHAGSAGG